MSTGDCLVAEIGVLGKVKGDPSRFVIARAVATPPAVDWYSRNSPGPREPSLMFAVRASDVTPPVECWDEVGTPSSNPVWTFGSRDLDLGRGELLATALSRDVVAFLDVYSDRDLLLGQLLVRPSVFRGFASKELAILVAKLDRIPRGEAEAIISGISIEDPLGKSIVDWAESYLLSGAIGTPQE